MRIEVHDEDGCFDDQARVYAEYRLFSSLAAVPT